MAVAIEVGQATGVLIDITPNVIEQHNGYKVVPAVKAFPTKATGQTPSPTFFTLLRTQLSKC